MSYNFKKLSEVEIAEIVDASAHILIEENGEIKRVSKDQIGSNTESVINWNDIEDKPFGVESTTEAILETRSVNFGYLYSNFATVQNDNLTAKAKLEAGQMYKVTFDGETHMVEAGTDNYGEAILGCPQYMNPNKTDGTHAFTIAIDDNMRMTVYIASQNDGSATLKDMMIGVEKVTETIKTIPEEFLPAGGGATDGVSSWNDLTDKPFDIVEGTDSRLVWDGVLRDTFVKFYLNGEDYGAYDAFQLVSNEVPTSSDLEERCLITGYTIYDGEKSEYCRIYNYDNGIVSLSASDLCAHIVPTDNFYDEEVIGITFPKKGIYFRKSVGDDGAIYNQVKTLSINGMSYEGMVAKPIDEFFIPDSIQRVYGGDIFIKDEEDNMWKLIVSTDGKLSVEQWRL